MNAKTKKLACAVLAVVASIVALVWVLPLVAAASTKLLVFAGWAAAGVLLVQYALHTKWSAKEPKHVAYSLGAIAVLALAAWWGVPLVVHTAAWLVVWGVRLAAIFFAARYVYSYATHTH